MSARPQFLILGASGFVGRHLYKRLGPDEAIATYHSTPADGYVHFDATTMRLRDTLLKGNHGIAAVFLLYGITKIDTCAREPDRTARVNVDSMLQAIDDLVEAGVKPVYASSDAVFDGKRGGWTENDPPNPILTYGKQKALVEQHLRAKPSPWIIARLSKIVGADDDVHGLLGEWVRQIEAGEVIRCATDLVFTPAHVDDAVDALVSLAQGSFSGIFNVCGPRSMSRMALLNILLRELRRYRSVSPTVVACSIREFKFVEPRPLDGSILPAKLYDALGARFRTMESVCAELAKERYGEKGLMRRDG
jgi:dTDP-4-dehydrorhamnose reductase